MMLKKPISAKRDHGVFRIDADIADVGREMRGDERDLKAADEEAGGQKHIGTMAKCLAQRIADALFGIRLFE
jgi:hypothetical protein